jgi:hypothetical protein
VDDGLWLQLATFSTTAVQEAEQLLVGDVVGRVEVVIDDPNAPSEMPVVDYGVRFVVMLAAEVPPDEPVTLTLTLARPDEYVIGRGQVELNFRGLPRASLLMPITLRLSAEGRYWMTIALEHRVLTRVPLDVAYSSSRPASALDSGQSTHSGGTRKRRSSARRPRRTSDAG